MDKILHKPQDLVPRVSQTSDPTKAHPFYDGNFVKQALEEYASNPQESQV